MTLFDLHNPEPSSDLPAMSAHARRTDPQTSHDAARSIRASRMVEVQDRILFLLHLHGGLTQDAVIEGYRMRWGSRDSDSSIRTRLSELCDAGKVRDSGIRKSLPKTGRTAILWELVK